MKTKLILTLASILLMVTGLRAQTPYAVYCGGDKSFHFLTSDTELKEGGTLESNGLAITSVWEIDLQGNTTPKWYSSSIKGSVQTVIFEDSFKDVKPQGCCGWFRGFSALSNIQNISLLNTSDMTDISSLFNGCSSLRSIDLSNFNTANATNMSALFCGCKSLQTLNLRGFVTDNVTNMREMLGDCSQLTSLDLSSFTTVNVTDMQAMFSGCSKLANLDLSNFNTEKVTTMYEMFYNCTGLKSLDLSSFNTENVNTMCEMFRGCTSLTSLDLSNFNTGKVRDMTYMFSGCSNLTLLDLSNFNTENVTTMPSMFSGCSNLTLLDLSNFNTKKVTSMSGMFNGCSNLTSLDLCSFNTEKVTTMTSMFNGCSNLANIYVSDTFTTDNVTAYYSTNLFNGCIQLRNYDASLTNKTNANYGPMGYLNFVGAHAVLADGSSALTFKNGAVDYNQPTYYFLNSGDDAPEWSGNDAIESVVFDESFSSARPTTCYGWFSSCPNLTVINGLGYLNTSELSAPSGIFAGCSGLRLVDMSQAAYDCSALLNNLTENALVYVPVGTTLSDGRANVVVGGTCDHFIINNAGGSDQNLLSVPYNFTANKVTINRKFEAGTPYSLHLPFAMSAIEDGTLYKYTGFTDTTVQFDPVDATEAHIPYMFTPDDDLTDGIVINQSVAVQATTAEAAEGDGYIGVYKKKVFTEDEIESGLYFGWAETEFHPAGSGSSVDACRAYFKLPAGEATTARITAKFGDKVTTGLSQITVEQPAADSPAYNLNGQRVSDNHRGIIIKDGKKIINN